MQCARGGVWVSGRQGCPASGQEDVLAAEARPLSLVPPSSVAGWDAGHLLVADQPPGRDMPRGGGGFLGESSALGVLRAQHQRLSFYKENQTLVSPEPWGSSSSLCVAIFLRKEYQGHEATAACASEGQAGVQ